MKVGEIYLNKYAGVGNPCRVFIVTSFDKKFVYGKCEQNGKLDRVYFPASHITNDTEHFVKIGHLNYDKVIADKLAEMKGETMSEEKQIEKIIEQKKGAHYSESEKNFSDEQIMKFLYRAPCNVTVFTVIQDCSGEQIEVKLRDIIAIIERQREEYKRAETELWEYRREHWNDFEIKCRAIVEFAERVKAHTAHLFSGVDVRNIVNDLVKETVEGGK